MFRLIDGNGKAKYAGRSRAIVTDNRDPLNKGKITVNHPLLGDTVWIDYINPPGQFNPPAIGDIVYVEADSGYGEFPIAHGTLIAGLDSDPDVPNKFKRTVPSNRGWQTPGGNSIELDDGVGITTKAKDDTFLTTAGRGIRITTLAGSTISISEDPDDHREFILIENNDGSSFKIDKTNKQMVWSDSNNNSIVINKITNTITSTNANNKIFKLSNHQILGQGTEHMVLGDTWFTMMNTFLSSVISGINPGNPGQNAASLTAIKAAATTLQSSLPNLKSPNSFTD